jgi:hypothetical protein
VRAEAGQVDRSLTRISLAWVHFRIWAGLESRADLSFRAKNEREIWVISGDFALEYTDFSSLRSSK